MLTPAELDLPHLPMERPEFAADPFPYFTSARTKHPWLATSAFGYVVHEYAAMRELFGQDDKLRPSLDGVVAQLGAEGTAVARWAKDNLLSIAPEQHRQLRDAFAMSFTPRRANELRPLIRDTVTNLLDEWAPKGAFDFEEFASWFPISILFVMLGAPPERIADIRDDLETLGLVLAMDPGLTPALAAAAERLETFAGDLIAARRATGRRADPPDLLDDVVAAAACGQVAEAHLSNFVMSLLMAAYDTSKNLLTIIMSLLIRHPKVYKRCGEDFDYCRRAIEEAVRYCSSGTAFRYTTQDVVFREVLLPQGTMLFFPFSISGRDPGSFADPDRFDPDRPVDPDRRHIAFGLGRHMCLGQHIARAQLQEALHLIVQRLHEPRLAAPHGWRPFYGVWGLKGLPISFTPRGVSSSPGTPAPRP
jgi:cytochrome P450